MSSSTIESIIRQAPNLCGVKLTYACLTFYPLRPNLILLSSCGGSVGKLIRLKAAINSNPSINASRPFPFLLLDGLIADITPWMQCGGHGTVSGIPNFAPAATMRLWQLLNQEALTQEESFELEKIQSILSNADVAAVPAGVRGMSKSIF